MTRWRLCGDGLFYITPLPPFTALPVCACTPYVYDSMKLKYVYAHLLFILLIRISLKLITTCVNGIVLSLNRRLVIWN
jgi:hypothetical protein